MIRGLYTAATGMTAQQLQLDVISNNIANVNTAAFKKDRGEFEDLMYQSLNYTSGVTSVDTKNPTGINVGLGVKISGVQKNFSQGSLKATGHDLDIAIEGQGFFKVTLPNGETAYTRNGAFKTDKDGYLVNAKGFKLNPEIVIPNNLTNISIAADGTVSGFDPTTGEATEIGKITIVNFVNPAGLTPYGESLFLKSDTSGDPLEGEPGTSNLGSLKQGMLESSNVSLVQEMVDLIQAQRAYEANSKTISTADNMLDTANRIKK